LDRLDSLSNLIKEPLLLLLISSGLDNTVLSRHNCKHSIEEKIRDNIERSINEQLSVLIKTLGSFFGFSVKIDNRPFLVWLAIVGIGICVLSFFILVRLNFQDLT